MTNDCKDYVQSLLSNVHEDLPLPDGCKSVKLVKGIYKYYHYGCDGFDDKGWGCGYRTLMSLCSWIGEKMKSEGLQNIPLVPSNHQIQQILVEIGDKNEEFVNSKQWIGSVEVFMVLSHWYGVPSKIIHLSSETEMFTFKDAFWNHFEKDGSPIMMGGDTDCSSKGVVGICESSEETYLLIVDPHFYGVAVDKSNLWSEGWVYWKGITTFNAESFYNICMPKYNLK